VGGRGRAVGASRLRASRSARHTRASCAAAKFTRIRVEGCGRAWNRLPGARSQPSSCSSAARRSVSTPHSTQPNRPCGGAAKVKPASCASRVVRARAAVEQALDHALGMAPQQPLLQGDRQRALGQPRRRQRREQLAPDRALGQRGRRSHEADAPARRQDLGEAR
jgi:hypothetical protein